jgi:ethylmalonyl-CoA mutase
LVEKLSERLRDIESGERPVVGVNVYAEGESSPLVEGLEEGTAAVERIERATEGEQNERLARWRKERDPAAVRRALDAFRRSAEGADELVPASIECARAGVTTGEWAGVLREVSGEYRPPTGLSAKARTTGGDRAALEAARKSVAAAADRLGVRKVRLLVAKPGLDGHSNAAEQLAVRARDCGFEVIYQGIRLSPADIARAAADEDVHVIGLSILSGAHMLLVPDVLACLRAEGVDLAKVPVVVGGIIPDHDAKDLLGMGVARVFTPNDHDLTAAVAEIASLLG